MCFTGYLSYFISSQSSATSHPAWDPWVQPCVYASLLACWRCSGKVTWLHLHRHLLTKPGTRQVMKRHPPGSTWHPRAWSSDALYRLRRRGCVWSPKTFPWGQVNYGLVNSDPHSCSLCDLWPPVLGPTCLLHDSSFSWFLFLDKVLSSNFNMCVQHLSFWSNVFADC